MRPAAAAWAAVAAGLLLALLLAPPCLAAPADLEVVDEDTIMLDLRQLMRRLVPSNGSEGLPQGWALEGEDLSLQHCAWPYVTCDIDKRVTELKLMDLVYGVQPGAADGRPSATGLPRGVLRLSQLSRLKLLQLHWPWASLAAPIEPEWLQPGVWPNMESLDLRLQKHMDALPLPDIPERALPALQHLELVGVDLRSTLPRSWGSPRVLPALRSLSLQLEVQGGLPAWWAHGFLLLESLVLAGRLHAPQQQAGGAAGLPHAPPAAHQALPPGWVGGFPRLQSVVVAGLGLTGAWPDAWLQPGSFPVLTTLKLRDNALTGTLPPRFFAALPRLAELYLSSNSFSGSLPPDWAGSQVDFLELGGNQLTGPAIPPAWLDGSMPNLRLLHLSNNSALYGTLPPSLPTRFPRIVSLALDGLPAVTGTIPQAWCTSGTNTLAELYVRGSGIDPTLPRCAAASMDRLEVHVLGGPSNETSPQAAQEPVVPAEPSRQAALIGLAIVLPLCAVIAGVFGSRLLLRRARRRRSRRALEQEQQHLLLLHPSGSSSEQAGPQAATQPSALVSRVRPLRRSRIGSLLSTALGPGGSGMHMVQLDALQAEVAHQLASAGADAPMQAGGAAAGHGSVAAQQLPGSRPAAFLELSSMPAGGEAQRLLGAQGSTGGAGAVAGSSSTRLLASRQWGLPTESLRVSPHSIQFVRDEDGSLTELGHGTFSVVYLARLLPAGKHVAAKVFELQAGVDSGEMWREAALLRQCEHPRIVPILGIALKGKLLAIAMEHMPLGCLDAALHDADLRKELRWEARGRQVAHDVAEALDHLHTQLGILHSDLKPMNVLLSADLRACVSDLGLARMVGADARTAAGFSRLYAAPEHLMGDRCTLAADIFSFGLILVTLLTQQVLRTRADWLLPRVPLGCPEEVTALVELCLASDPLARPSAAQVLAQLRAAPHAVRTEYTATHFNQSDNDDSYSQ